MSNRYRELDPDALGAILRALQRPGANVEELRERLADFDPVDVLLTVAAWGKVQRDTFRTLRTIEELERDTRTLERRLAKHRLHAVKHTRRCATCNREFYGVRADAKTCSPACRQKLHRLKVKRSAG